MSQAKVVSLKVPQSPRATIPPVLNNVRHHAKRQINELLQHLFNNTDDALFEMADRSRSDSNQDMFFQSMRQIRLHRKEIASRFLDEFYQAFEAIYQPGGPEEADDLDLDAVDDKFALIADDELEISVAVAGIVSKITSQFSLPIMQLTKRVDHVCSVRDVTERTNPLGPHRVSSAFVNAIDGLNIDIKVRIILLKLFERFVMERLGPVYDKANAVFTEAGVLKDLKKVIRKGSGQTEAGNARAEASEGAGQSGGGVKANQADVTGQAGPAPGGPLPSGQSETTASTFNLIRGLLARARPAQASPVARSSGGETITTARLLNLLSKFQARAEQQPFDLDHIPKLLDLPQVVVANTTGGTGSAGANIGQADEDAVNFVGMLFDYILNDRNLAIPMKALIGRLQIPIVKLAVLDKSFFEKPGHPARQLLNELSSAGIGWSSSAELKRDALYNKIESIVLRVMDGFKDDANIFGELIAELREFIVTDRKRNMLVEQRVKETEAGKARTNAAKAKVQDLINEKASGMRLPPDVGRFISDTWSKVLIFAHLKDGPASESWEVAVKVLDDLLWCLQPLNEVADLARRDEIVPTLLRDMEASLRHLNLSDQECDDSVSTVSAQLALVAENDRMYLEGDGGSEMYESFEELEELVLAPKEEPEELVNEEPEPEFLQQVGELEEGVWVELIQISGDKVRCKLAAIVEPGDRYVFVNRRGMKVVEKSQSGLAVDLKRKNLVILDESQVFDRALRSVISNLRQMQDVPVAE